MSDAKSATERVSGFCALCVSRCGAIATLEDGKFVALEPDPSHPTGQALCIKGRVAPELVYHPDRLLYPMKRTRPKGDSDPGWQRIGWDEALDTMADKLKHLADRHGPESVVFTTASPSTSALSDSLSWIGRLRKAFGTPNHCLSMELCGWGRYLASQYVYGAAVPGEYLPDLDHAGCILYWGYNPTVARITHATATVAALKRGARLIVVDPRRAGLAGRADHWLQVRPGSDGALALGLANVMIARGWYDKDFVRDWTNAALLVRSDSGRFLREADLVPSGDSQKFVAWDGAAARPVAYDPAQGTYDGDVALFGTFDIETTDGIVACQPVFQLTADMCARYTTDEVERVTGVAAGDVEAAARTMWQARPTAFYSWSGIEQQTNATQIARAIALLYSLTGNFDAKGGNVLFPGVPMGDIAGEDLLSADQQICWA
jgi:anaerobic selenocysteine-containing dehydrogenase